MPKALNAQRHASVLATANAIVIKDENIFFLSLRDSSVPLQGKHGLGLYYDDCRFLSGHEITVGKAKPISLAGTAPASYCATFALCNDRGVNRNGSNLKKRAIDLRVDRIIDSKNLSLLERITFRNREMELADVDVTLRFKAGFEDVFIVRGTQGKKTGRLHPPQWRNGTLRFTYSGVDQRIRSLAIQFHQTAHHIRDGAKFRITLEPQQTAEVKISYLIAQSSKATEARPRSTSGFSFDRMERSLAGATRNWHSELPEIHSDSHEFNDAMNRSMIDHRVLRSTLDRQHYYAAGLPWYGCLFGRDSIIAAIEMLAYSQDMAAQSLRILAQYQGKRNDTWRDEQPGKILHEFRTGELARSGQIPQTPYYGSVDSTPLFLILLSEYCQWSGDLSLFHELRPNVDAALNLVFESTWSDPDRFLAYQSESQSGLSNQGWKDSGDSMVNADGSLATPPIALVEVQGYVYREKKSLAKLFARLREKQRAEMLAREAENLRESFERKFWLSRKKFYAMALQKEQRPCAVISSNPGQALWSGICSPARAKLVAAQLMQDDMFSGWGVRTLSSRERRYNPVGYHLGSVWPHDNAIVAMGLKHYGLDQEFLRIFDAMLEAASYFEHHRLPEVFSGYSKREFYMPVPYPEACHPQVWAAGALPMMLQAGLGLQPDAFEQTLHIVRPMLPAGVNRLDFRGLHVGKATVDLRFERSGHGFKTTVVRNRGQLKVRVQQR
jgi:glycogen debranching enzyme